MKADISVYRACLEEDHLRVEEDKPCLRNMGVVCEKSEIRGSSRLRFLPRPCGDLPKTSSIADKIATIRGYPLSLIMPYRIGGVKLPNIAGRALKPIYGTLFLW